MKLRDFISPGEILVDAGAAIINKIRNRPKAVARRAAREEKRKQRHSAQDAAGGEFLPHEEDVPMNLLIQLLGSIARTAGPAAAAYLAGKGIIVAGMDPETVVGVAFAVYVGAQLWSLGRKVLRHFEEK